MSELLNVAKSLSEIEKKTLKALKPGNAMDPGRIAARAKIPIDSARRAIAWLEEKKLVETQAEESVEFFLSAEGKRLLPERRLVEAVRSLGGKANLNEVRKKSKLGSGEFNAAIGRAKRMNWIVFPEKGKIEETGLHRNKSEEERVIEMIEKGAFDEAKHDGFLLKELVERGLVERKESKKALAGITRDGEIALSIALKTKKRDFALGEVESIHLGKKQPYEQFLEQIRAKLATMGFKEMKAPLIVQEFYNFDVLFQPQNHPARTWTNTYQLKNPKEGDLPDKKKVKAVKDAHEFGARTGSIGWRYQWHESIARKLMPSAHGTSHSARQLIEGVEVPGKYFAIARCYRPDTVDKTHLIEFNQLEGIIAGDLSFKHLLGMLKQFAEEIANAKEVKFYPDYYPFTEPSVQLSAKHPKLGWIEFGGAGLFRPEMLEPLGIKCNVLAWGLGIDRLAMFKLGIDDMRELFSQKLDWLRGEKFIEVD